MTYQPAQSPQDTSVYAGTPSDVRTFLAATLLTFSAGLLVLLGYGLFGGFGAFLALIADVFGVVWWNSLHGKVFPKNLPAKSVGGVGGVAVVLLLLVWAIS